MTFIIMWSLIALCLCRVFYTGVKERNYGYVLGSLVLLAWAIYRILCYSDVLPPDMVINRVEGIKF